MKTLAEVDKLLLDFEKKYGLNVRDAQQGSEVWMNLKLGVMSASNAKKIVAGRTTQTRFTYMAQLVGEICTGIFPEINAKQMSWGKDNEDAARSSYEFGTGNRVQELLFAFKDKNFRAGCSPDGLVSDTKGAEIKTPFATENYIQFLTADKIKPDYEWQYQFTLWVMEADEWDFVQFDPRMKKNPIHIVTVNRDKKKIETIEESVKTFTEDMDKVLKKAGFEFGDQWKRLKGQQMEAVS